ncbi:MAG: tRNA pseudouridine(38-40) synthase TruA [Eubacteriales bacterium]|nr:tRNA pseudouridine(38-40) synthase TruA [Eubacteriales bacterium]MDD4389779.1 tRNA pseudouridine(38-40) synthase TruA [Eubacteriales bacterium]
MKNVLLSIEYDGTNFCGWQRQPAKRTVQGELEKVLADLCCVEVSLNGTSRTDAGVHALGQRACFKGEFAIPLENIGRAANNILAGGNRHKAGDVRIKEVQEMPLDFHARFDAKGKTYLYRLATGEVPSVFARNYSYFIKDPLDVALMSEAAAHIVGKHDFKCFEAAGGNPRETTVRTITALEVTEADGGITLAVTGDGFLYNMVRIITGTLVDVGSGRIRPDEIPGIITSCDRQNAGHTAPPQGLYLAEVYFDRLPEIKTGKKLQQNSIFNV